MSKELNVTKLNIPAGAPVEKGINNGGRPCFLVRGTFTLADGSEVQTRVTSERKKNLATAIQREQEAVAAGSVSHNPETGMTCTRFTIGSRGLQPFTGHQASGIPAPSKPATPQVAALPGMTPLGTRPGTTFANAVATSNTRNGFNEADCGGVFDGNGVVSDADPGL